MSQVVTLVETRETSVPARAAPRADLAFGLAGAAAGTAGLVLLHHEPLAAAWFMVFLLAVLLFRWHARADLVALLVGATLGNLTEFLCDVKGVWVHSHRDIAGVAPPYIFVCYPILWLTVPRLMDALVGRPRPSTERGAKDAFIALLLWGAHTGLSFVFGTENTPEGLVCIALLALTAWRFHAPHDLAHLAFGGALGLVWELPATAAGAWWFPHPTILGLVPWWLPLAYAIFFCNLGRVVGFVSPGRVTPPGPSGT